MNAAYCFRLMTRATGALFMLCVIVLLASAAAAAQPAETDLPPEDLFDVTVLASGGTQPMELAIAPDGRVFWCGKQGDVTLYNPQTKAISVVAKLPTFTRVVGTNQMTEDGLLGIALDPDFMTNHWIYLMRAVPGTAREEHVSRFVLTNDKLDVDSEKVLLVIRVNPQMPNHFAGCLSFGPDGDLYISTGDNTTPFESDGYAPLDARNDGKDSRMSAANTMDLRGKILRIHPRKDGTIDIPTGNLFPPGTPKTRPEIYVMGCRNPFRFSIDSKTGYLYWGEVGPDSYNTSERGPMGYDEFNQAKKPGNFGWPLFVGNNQSYAAFDFATKTIGPHFDPLHPVNDAPHNAGLRELPPAQPAWIWYPYGKSAEFPELGDGGRAAMAGPVYRYDDKLQSTTKFPPSFDGKIFIFDWMRNWVKVVGLGANDEPAHITPFLPSFAWRKPIDMRFGPEGSLYVILWGAKWDDNDDATILRIDYAGGVHAPIAKASADVTAGKEPLRVTFSSAGTFERDKQDVLRYAWSFNGDAIDSTEPSATFTYDKPGVYQAKLTVTEQTGKSSSSTLRIVVGNAVPRLTIVEPKDRHFFTWGKPITYQLQLNDAEDGTSDDHAVAERIKLGAQYVTGTLVRGQQLVMGGQNDCLTCHQLSTTLLGPAFSLVAAKYHDNHAIAQQLAQKVITGFSGGTKGVWGQLAMSAHPQLKHEDALAMVSWVLSLADVPPPVNGATGSLAVMSKPVNDGGDYVLTATYTDTKVTTTAGQVIPSNTVHAQVTLRSRLMRIEDSDDRHDLHFEDCSDVNGGRDLGYIADKTWVRFSGITLDGTSQMIMRVATQGLGGTVELHADAVDGPLLGHVEVKPTGGWQNWVDVSGAVRDPGGTHDLYLVCRQAGAGALFNLNWVHFVAPEQ